MTEYERVGLVFTKTQVYKFGHCKGILWQVFVRELEIANSCELSVMLVFSTQVCGF
jgi:hypothetical protein